MKKFLLILLVLVVLGFGIFSWIKDFNNTAVVLREDAKTAWANVESAYQRRQDLIGNLVKTVQGAADFEKTTLTQVIEARSKATATTIDIGSATPQQLQTFQQAQSGLSSALSRLLVTVERYPELKANRNFLELQTQLEGTENRINVERNRYNEVVNNYNKHLAIFPNNLLASMLNFKEMNRFKADEGSEKAPDVDFNF